MTEYQSLYERDGDHFIGTRATASGWDPDTQSGGAVLALLGHLLDDVPTLTPMSLTRFTVDILRPVPIGPRLHVELRVAREGKLIQLVDAMVRVGDTEFVRARALRIREGELPRGAVPASTADDRELLAALPAPHDLPDVAEHPGVAGFLVHGAELRRNTQAVDGPACSWVRLRIPVLAGEPVRTTSRTTLPMDCMNLIGVLGLPPGVTAINPDVSAHLMRPTAGEWVGLVGDTRFAGAIGHGFSSAFLADRDGVFGTSSTSQIVQHHG